MPTRLRVCAVVLVSCVCCGDLTDSATRVTDLLAQGASKLDSQPAGSSVTVPYEPVAGLQSPYFVLFFPAFPAKKADLKAAGVPDEITNQILSQLAYLGDQSNLLVVVQEGQYISFTSAWRRVAEVKDLVVSKKKTGVSQIELRKEDGVVRIVAVH